MKHVLKQETIASQKRKIQTTPNEKTDLKAEIITYPKNKNMNKSKAASK
jgi:cell division protein FtsB